MFRIAGFVTAVALLMLLASAGCDQIKPEPPPPLLPPIAEDNPGAPRPKAKESDENLDPDGSAKISVHPPIDSPTCWFRTVPSELAGGIVIQLFNYPDPAVEKAPSFFIQGVIDSDSLESLSDKSISCEVFVNPAGSDGIWFSPEDQPVTIEFSYEDGQLKATFQSHPLTNSATRIELPVDGEFLAVPAG